MLYNLVLILGALIALPKWLFSKKYRHSRLERLGFSLPKDEKWPEPVIWMHMVSLGETKVMIPIYKALRVKYPNGTFFFSSVTATGMQEAKRNLPGGQGYFFLPLDTSWNMRRLVQRIKPNLVILSESDFWLNMLTQAKKWGAKIFLLNGKISEKSAHRFAKIPFFTKKLFAPFDHFCLQSEEYANRFISLGIPRDKITITGNLKLAIPFVPLTHEEKDKLRAKFGIGKNDRVITVGSTHGGEEELILQYLPKDAKILILPRHPHRFPEVKKLLEKENSSQHILVEEMGVLTKCFQISELAILGGSFVPGIGGHNIFEPIQAQIPVIFGPYMETQQELVKLILEAKAGIQTPVEGLPSAIASCKELVENVKKISSLGQQVLDKTLYTKVSENL